MKNWNERASLEPRETLMSWSNVNLITSLVYLVDNLIQEKLQLGKLDKNFIENLNMKLDKPEILRETILNKAEILLSELSN